MKPKVVIRKTVRTCSHRFPDARERDLLERTLRAYVVDLGIDAETAEDIVKRCVRTMAQLYERDRDRG